MNRSSSGSHSAHAHVLAPQDDLGGGPHHSAAGLQGHDRSREERVAVGGRAVATTIGATVATAVTAPWWATALALVTRPTWLGNIACNLAAMVVTAVHRTARRVRIARLAEGYECKSTQFPCISVGWKVNILDIAKLHEVLLDHVLVNPKGDAAAEDL
eukprot:CAMPEP_0115866352 /NCGR_PEP_ID=MMETSP0287-20121206/20203_1 /TAXON_ID=412157 /ORGANISM="Chrysochromulina rotalis, Strain UIO044" /LENGTH=157 /DNA_ID=CAMNT_0003320913 /DNA_START=348 /DNA_END=819 /DNA_ORIENTATION=-